jgi:histidine triad (HIT) family protein
MDVGRVPMDLATYGKRILGGPCFVCGVVGGDPEHAGEPIVYEDDAHIAFLDRYPTVYGKVLGAPKAHIEHVVIPWSPAQATELGAKLRSALRDG